MTPVPTKSDTDNHSMRRLVFEALQMRLASERIPLLPDKLAASIIDRAVADLNASPSIAEGALSLSSMPLLNAVSVSFSTVLSQYSEPQLRALRLGIDPSNPAAVAALMSGGLSRLQPGQPPEGDVGQFGARSGRRYSDMRGDDGRMAGQRQFAGLDGDTVVLFKATGLSQGVFNDLIQRYTLNEIRQAAGFAGDLGVNASAFAGKFIKLNEKSRENLHEFVDEVKSQDGLSDAEKTKQIDAYRKAHPDIAKILSNKDMFTIVNSHNKHMAEHDIDRAKEMTDVEKRAAAKPAEAVKSTARDTAADQSKQQQVAAVDDAFGVTPKKAETKPAQASIRKPAAAPA